MKVLFAVNTESSIKSIIDFYKDAYGEKIENTNVYFFRSLLDTLKKNKNGFDRIVIHEELEPMGTKNQDVIDRYLLNNIDKITDEAGKAEIIFICGENRKKDDKLLTKMFNIGVFNILIGDSRTVGKVCELINKPRTKKDAKRFLEIDIEGVTYEDPNKVDEMELRNIISYYEKNQNVPEKVVAGFESLYEQYSIDKLKNIINFLPSQAREILSRESERYMAIMGYAPSIRPIIKYVEQQPKEIVKIVEVPIYINENKNAESPKAEPPKVETSKVIATKVELPEVDMPKIGQVDIEPPKVEIPKVEVSKAETQKEEPLKEELEALSEVDILTAEPLELEVPKIEPPKVEAPKVEPPKIEPPKIEPPKIEIPKVEMPKVEPPKVEPPKVEMPKVEPPKVEPPKVESPRVESPKAEPPRVEQPYRVENPYRSEPQIQTVTQVIEREVIKEVYETPRDYKKAVCFIGAHKTGTTFMINAIAAALTGRGVKTAILDLTKNKDTYLIYAANDTEDKVVAANSLGNLAIGQNLPYRRGNLSIYTGLPRVDKTKYDCLRILETIRRENSVILIDCDFTTPIEIFRLVNNIYVVQDMDILNVLPITMFLKELKVREVDLSKVEIIVNKYIKSTLSVAKLIEAISFYTNPEMTFVEELLSKNIRRFIVTFDEQNYMRYIEGLYSSKLNFGGYSEEFKQSMVSIVQDVFPVTMKQTQPSTDDPGFLKNIFKKMK